MIKFSTHVLFCFFCLALLSGCQKTAHTLLEMDYKFDKSMVKLGGILQETFDRGYQEQTITSTVDLASPRYCYRTIGEVECFKDPLPGARQRLLGVDTDSVDYSGSSSYAEWVADDESTHVFSPPPGASFAISTHGETHHPTLQTSHTGGGSVKVSQSSKLPMPLSVRR